MSKQEAVNVVLLRTWLLSKTGPGALTQLGKNQDSCEITVASLAGVEAR